MTDALFARDGHALDLALDRLLLEELSPAEETALQVHVRGCPPCTRRLEAAREAHAGPLPALNLPGAVVELRPPGASAPAPSSSAAPPPAGSRGEPANNASLPAEPANHNVVSLASRRRMWTVAGAALALAAGLLLVVTLPGPETDLPPGELPIDRVPENWTAKGAGLALEVHREENGGSTRLASGDAVRAGDRLGFRAAAKEPGYLLVIGVDSAGQPYACYPQGAAPEAALIQPSAEPTQLPTAIQMDAAAGQERIVAVLCPEPFGYAPVASALSGSAAGLAADQALPLVREGCAQQEVRLQKEAL